MCLSQRNILIWEVSASTISYYFQHCKTVPIWNHVLHRFRQAVAICLVLPIRWLSDASPDICQLPPDICQTSTTFTPDIYHISDRYQVDVWYMSGGHLVYIWYSICLVGIWYMSGVYMVLVWQMSGETSDRHLTIVWWSSDREHQTNSKCLVETVVYDISSNSQITED